MTSLCSAHVRNLTYTLNWHGGEFASKSRRWPSTVESRFAWALFCDLFVELFSHFWLSQSFGNVPALLPLWGLSILFLLVLSIWVIWQKSRKSKPFAAVDFAEYFITCHMVLGDQCDYSFIVWCFYQTVIVYFRIVSNFSSLKSMTLLVHAGLFWCFHRNPPNSDVDYRIFDVRMWSFCMRMHTGDLGL